MNLWDWVFRRRRHEEDLEEEVQAHLRMAAQERIEQGEATSEARASAIREFGNVGLVKEVTRAMWGFQWLETWLQDLRYGLRQLRRNPGFTAVAVLTLALGIGGTTVIFSVVECAVLDPFPFPRSERLAVLGARDLKLGTFEPWWWVSASEFLDYREQSHVFSEVFGWTEQDALLTGSGAPEGLTGAWVTENCFRVLGVPPLIGRAFLADDYKPGAPPVAVLGYKLWRSRFAGDRGIVGRSIVLNHQQVTVIGVMPARFSPGGGDLFLPATLSRGQSKDPPQYFALLGQLKPGVTMEHASAEVAVLGKRLASAYPKDHPPELVFGVESLADSDSDMNGSGRTFYILFGAVGFLFLIACVNVANLLLARARAREREVAVRAALGASRIRLIRQFLIESLTMALAGGALGCLFAWSGLGTAVAFIPPDYIPSEAAIRINAPVLLFTLCGAVFATLLFGLAPALLAVGRDLQEPLKASGRAGGESRSHSRLRNLLVVSEVALSLVLLMGAGLLIRSYFAARHADLGCNPDHLLAAFFHLPEERYKTAAQRDQFQHEALRRVRALPGVVSAALGVPPLLSGFWARFEITGNPSPDTRQAQICPVSGGLFETMGIPLLGGRPISEEDFLLARKVAVVNRTFVDKYFSNEKAIGQEIKVESMDFMKVLEPRFEIIGVAGDTGVKYKGPDQPADPQIYLPGTTALGTPWTAIVVRTVPEPASLLNSVQRAVNDIDKDLWMEDRWSGPFQNIISNTYFPEARFVLAMLVAFASLGLALVSVGVYGVLSYSVSRRTHEIGVRMALGAEATDVRRWVLKDGLRWLLVGAGIGVSASIALAKVLQNRIWGIKSADPLTLAAVSLVLTAVGLAACYFPARRATKVDPMVALRCE